MIRLEKVWVNQDWIRDPSQIKEMIEKVKLDSDLRNPMSWNKCNPKIYISVFPDGTKMIHDGHHRCIASWIAGKEYLEEDEYEEHNWTYEDYNTINFERMYVTPHHPKVEIRLPDLTYFREAVKVKRQISEASAIQYILNNGKMYCKPRTINTLPELALLYQAKCMPDSFIGERVRVKNSNIYNSPVWMSEGMVIAYDSGKKEFAVDFTVPYEPASRYQSMESQMWNSGVTHALGYYKADQIKKIV